VLAVGAEDRKSVTKNIKTSNLNKEVPFEPDWSSHSHVSQIRVVIPLTKKGR
jgi:hypothetical protein